MHNLIKNQNFEMIEDWTSVIKPKSGWFDINFREIFTYRDLIFLFVKRNFVSLYKQTILGPLWFFIQPLFTTIIFTVVFSGVAKISTDGLPPVVFYLSGIVMWNYFSDCLIKTSKTFIENANIFGKVYFPRLVMPISIVITNLITMGIQLLLFILILIYYKISGYDINPNLYIIFTPVLLLMMAFLGLGLGIIVSALTTKYRDLQFLVAFGVQLLMYATPVVYPFSSVPEKYKLLLLLNPMTAIIETFRYSFFSVGSFNVMYLLSSFIIIMSIITFGLLIFCHVEKSFMDTV